MILLLLSKLENRVRVDMTLCFFFLLCERNGVIATCRMLLELIVVSVLLLFIHCIIKKRESSSSLRNCSAHKQTNQQVINLINVGLWMETAAEMKVSLCQLTEEEEF